MKEERKRREGRRKEKGKASMGDSSFSQLSIQKGMSQLGTLGSTLPPSLFFQILLWI